ncbi:MAG: GNAT family N-acetyltransferase [Phycisphaerae bacterium]|nr:GNAT family N-acetyltransferase [Phycisphaerae bacterium]
MMSRYNIGKMKSISPVPTRKVPHALRHIICGTETDSGGDVHVESLRKLLKGTPRKRKWLWYARNPKGQIRSAAMVLVSKGSVPFLYHSPADGSEVHFESLVELLREISSAVLNREHCMVQRFVPENEHPDASALLAAGFEELVELVYMVLTLGDDPFVIPAAKGYEFVSYENICEGELEATIQQTYHGSQDCPRLVGVRPMPDIIESHKTTGLFTPQWWWVLRFEGKPAGCILLNRTEKSYEAEVIYLGVAPEFRGKTLGELMLKHGIASARSDGIKRMTLAVDSRNTVAVKLYEQFGFRKAFSRYAYARFAE